MHMIFNNPLFACVLGAVLCLSGIAAPADPGQRPYAEAEFLRLVMDKPIEEIKKAIGEPVSITKKNNFEFWLYEAIVRQGESDKIFKYTQLAISGGVIKNIGNSNRIMSR